MAQRELIEILKESKRWMTRTEIHEQCIVKGHIITLMAISNGLRMMGKYEEIESRKTPFKNEYEYKWKDDTS